MRWGIVALLLAAGVASAGNKNLLPNGGFEKDLEGWRVNAPMGMRHDFDRRTKKKGKQSLHVTKQGGFGGDSISATQGEQYGFVNQVVPLEDLLDAAMAYAERIVACSPVAVEVTLETVRESVSIPSLREAMKLDFKGGEKIGASPDFREGVKAFVEKRKPNWEIR